MPYTPQTWVDGSGGGTPVTAARLGVIETGIQTAQAAAEAAVAKSLVDAKGDLIVASGNDTPAREPIGADDTALVAASGQPRGVTWTKIGNAQIASAAAIAYSKLALAGQLKNSDIEAAAGISINKLQGYPTDGTKVLLGDGTWGSAGIRIYDRVATAVDVVNTTTETTIYSKSIAGGDMSTNRLLRLTLIGDFRKNGGDANAAVTLRFKFDGVTISTNSINTQVFTDTPRGVWRVTLHWGNANATNVQVGDLYWLFNRQDNTPYSQSGIGMAGTADTTVAKTLSLTAQWSQAHTSVSLRCNYALLELV